MSFIGRFVLILGYVFYGMSVVFWGVLVHRELQDLNLFGVSFITFRLLGFAEVMCHTFRTFLVNSVKLFDCAS